MIVARIKSLPRRRAPAIQAIARELKFHLSDLRETRDLYQGGEIRCSSDWKSAKLDALDEQIAFIESMISLCEE